MPKYRLRAYLYLLTVGIIWGAASPIIKFTLGGIDPLPFLAYRFFISGIIAIVILGIKPPKIHNLKKNLPLILLYGFMSFTIALGALFFGLDNSTVLELSLIGMVSPLVITLGGMFLFHDHVTKRERLGIGIAIAGVTINSIVPLFLGGSAEFSGNILLGFYLLADASSILISKKLLRDGVDPIATTLIGFIVAAVTLIPLAIGKYGFSEIIASIEVLPLKYHLGVWYMAILSGLVAYYLSNKAEKSIEVSEVSLFYYLQPIFTVPLAVLWLGEAITLPFILGASITALGVYIAEKKIKKLNSSNTS